MIYPPRYISPCLYIDILSPWEGGGIRPNYLDKYAQGLGVPTERKRLALVQKVSSELVNFYDLPAFIRSRQPKVGEQTWWLQ